MSNHTLQAKVEMSAERAGEPNAEEFLDDVFERALSQVEDGIEIDVSSLVQDRVELRSRIEEVVRVAREIVPGVERRLPTLPGYAVVSEIGRGGMGAVYLCRQQSLGGRPVAVKLLPRNFASSPHRRERFRAEATSVARLRHPNIVGVYEMFEVPTDSGRMHGFAMEWVPGLSLAQLLGELKSESGSAKTIMPAVCRVLGAPPNTLDRESYVVFVVRAGAAIASALNLVHQAGLLHRDVKPSNIMIRPDGTAMLTDFGLARGIDDGEPGVIPDGTFAGTPAYAPPEQLRSRGERLSPATDVYGLGATLYHALALRPAVEGNCAPDVLKQIEAGSVQGLRSRDSRISRDLETIVMKAMEPDPARRYSSAESMGDDLERLLRLEPIKARPGSWLARSIKRVRRNRTSMLAAAGTFAVTAVLTAILVLQVFLAPQWARANVQAARLALLDQNQVNGIFNLMLIGDDSGIDGLPLSGPLRSQGWHRRTIDSTDRALEAYAGALRWTPMDDDTALERDIVLLARRCLDGGSRALVPTRVQTFAPSAVRYLERWHSNNARPNLTENELDQATPQDLRSLGLLAALLGDMGTALRAWSRLDVEGFSDPFVDAWLGVVLIADDQPSRAYPRLRTATAAFPHTGFIHTYAAEAAARCGDLAKARRLIQDARAMSRQDDYGGLERVEGLIAAMQSTPEQVHLIYEALCAKDKYNAIRGRDYLRFLVQQNDRERTHTLAMLLAESEARGPLVRLTSEGVRLADEWWERLSVDERESFVRSVLLENPPGFMGWDWRDATFLSYYRTACQRLERAGTLNNLRETTALADADPSPFLQRASLRDVAAVVNIESASDLAALCAADPQGWAATAAAAWIAGRVYPVR